MDRDERRAPAPPLELIDAVSTEMNRGAVDHTWIHRKPVSALLFVCGCVPNRKVGVMGERITVMVRVEGESVPAEFVVGQCEVCLRFYWDVMGPVRGAAQVAAANGVVVDDQDGLALEQGDTL